MSMRWGRGGHRVSSLGSLGGAASVGENGFLRRLDHLLQRRDNHKVWMIFAMGCQ